MSKAQSVADVRENFRKQTDKMKENSEKLAKASQLKEQRPWMHPELGSWLGDLFDLKGMAEPFKRDENHNDLLQAVKSAESPGTTTDLIASQLQGDFLGTCERAFRERHKSTIRSRLHAAGRHYGSGHESGIVKEGIQNYIQWLIKTGKG